LEDNELRRNVPLRDRSEMTGIVPPRNTVSPRVGTAGGPIGRAVPFSHTLDDLTPTLHPSGTEVPHSSPGLQMNDRATEVGRALVDGVSALRDYVSGQVTGWVSSGDVSLMVILSAVALFLLVTIVVPNRRRY
jgi:hypothetical protein